MRGCSVVEIAAGNDVATATILGNSDVKMLRQVYGHLKKLLDDANGTA